MKRVYSMVSTQQKLKTLLMLVAALMILIYILTILNADVFETKRIKAVDSTDTMILPLITSQSRKYLIYTCEKEDCGGWANRIYGMVMTYMLARLSGRTFRIKHTKPCDVNLFLGSNIIDWKFSKSELQNFSSESINRFCSLELKRSLPTLDLKTFFKSDVVYFLINWDFTQELRLRRDIGKLSYFNQLTVAEIYRQTYEALFKYKPQFQRELDRYRLKKKGDKKLVCAHIRIPDDVQEYRGNADVIWNWFKSYNTLGYVFYFATSRQYLKDKAKEMFPTRLTDLPGVLTHVEKTKGDDACPGFKKALMDHAILSTCDVLLLSDSGFGITSAYRRGTSKDLFCLIHDAIMPCPVDILHEILIGNIGPHPHF